MDLEDRIMSMTLIMMMVSAGMALIACIFAFVALGLTLLKDGTVCEADPCPSGCGRAIETRVAARRDGANGRIVRQSEPGGKAGPAQRGVADTYFDDGERDGADVGDDDLARRDEAVALLDRFDCGAGDVAKLLPAERSPRKVGGNCRDGGSDTGAERRESGATGHDPLGSRDFFHGGDYSKSAAGAQLGEAAP